MQPSARLPRPVFILRSTPLITTLVVVLFLVPWLIVLYLIGHSANGILPATVSPREEVLSGPWGDLHVLPIILNCPSEQTLLDLDLTPYRQWTFSPATTDEIRQHFSNVGLDAQTSAELVKTAMPTLDGKGYVLHPPDNVVRRLSPTQRGALYAILSRNSANVAQNMPFCLKNISLREWFANSTVPADTIARIEPLLYKRGHYLAFSDPQLILPYIPQRYARIELIRVLRRVSTLRLNVSLRPGQPSDAALAYWGEKNRKAFVEPILPALYAPEGGVSVLALLPHFPNVRVYTYPSPDEPGGPAHCNCHWASLNFFNDPSDDRIALNENLSATLANQYTPLNSTTHLGDVVLLFHDNELVHSCVYVAGDIVFTKNGAGDIAPFIFEHLDDVVDGYREMYGSIKLGFCRRKGM